MNEAEAQNSKKPTPAQFNQVRDGRGRSYEGLWERNCRFYIQVNVPGKGPRRFPLFDDQRQPIKTKEEAVNAAVEFRTQRAEGNLPTTSKAPGFDTFQQHYIKWLTDTDAKSKLTITKEKGALKQWAAFLGNVRVTQITRKQINEYVLVRKAKGTNNRTVNLDIIALSNCLKFAKDENWFRREAILPTASFKALKWTAPKRTLLTTADIEKLCAEALRQQDGKPVYENGQTLADWIKFMAYSGARRQAALTATWAGVDTINRQLHLDTKYSKHVVVDFNPRLQAHLEDMAARRTDDTWIFPSTRVNDKGEESHLTNLHKTLVQVRVRAGLKKFTPHDCRHHFVSYAVMDGIDFMTIAKWVGHSDGGVLIGRVYGHLASEHTQKSASKLTFGVEAPKVEEKKERAPAPQPAPVLDVNSLSAEQLLALLQQKMAGNKAAA
jgi:integrase